MPKKKSAARILVADGIGGMVPVEDRRFEGGTWTVVREIPAAAADAWKEYMDVECTSRGWGWSSFGQIGADENSETITVHMGVPGQSPGVLIVWERPRNGPLVLRARPAGQPEPDHEQVEALIGRVDERLRSAAKQIFYKRAYLQYEGLPWQGELWLDDGLRLGPPAQHARWLSAPQIIVLDALVKAIGWKGANALFESQVQNLSLFLTVVMRRNVGLPPSGHAWTVSGGEKPQSELRSLGYMEQSVPSEMPERGQYAPVQLREIARPDFSLQGIFVGEHEEWLPADIIDLWRQYISLPPERRDQFQRVARVFKASRLLARENRTASLALRVVGCEALKPPGKEYDKLNIYRVVEGLLGVTHADRLRRLQFSPQRVRDTHLHRGELLGDEDIRAIMLSTFRDPTFDQEYGVVAETSDAAIIQWLRTGGTFATARKRAKKSAGK